MECYLASSTYVDWEHPEIVAKAAALADSLDDVEAIARRCFEFVRDEIPHSLDFQMNPVTCKASDVLAYGTGYCFAKSHLLAALLRANGIPAGLCYQRLSIDDEGPPYTLHGLNAVYLEPHGWYRVDPRGNKPGIDTAFCPPVEKLAFEIRLAGEADFPEVWAEPLTVVVEALTQNESYDAVARNLPDVATY